MQVELIRFRKKIDFIDVYFCEATNFATDAMCDVYVAVRYLLKLHFNRRPIFCIRFQMFAFLITRLTCLS